MMLSDIEREIAVAIVESVVEYGILESLSEGRAYDWFYDNELLREGFNVHCGMTKACISHDDLFDWVIKVGFTRGLEVDHAMREYQNYCFAEQEGLDYYFPKTVYLGEFGGRPFFLQEAVECDEDEITSEWYDRLRDKYDEEGEEYDCDRLWDEVYELEDEERAYLLFGNQKLVKFLKEHDIGDLHEGNFGASGDHLVICDFSGWIG